MNVAGNGLCLIYAIKHCLRKDHQIEKETSEIMLEIVKEIRSRPKFYRRYHNSDNLLAEVVEFLQERKYYLDCVDLAINATAEAYQVSFVCMALTNLRGPVMIWGNFRNVVIISSVYEFSQNLFFPGQGLSKFNFSWRMPLKIYFFLESASQNLFFS